MPTNAFPSTITQVDTAARFPLGYQVTVPAKGAGTGLDQGEEVWIYVFNDDAASLLQGTVCARDAATITADVIVAPVSSPTIRVVGVAQHTIAAGSYGFILRSGIGEVIADTGGITANTALAVGNAVTGTADDAAATTHAFGFATEVATATNLATCWINCPG
jgi:hypothetical protein